jgi:hypothetical protein
MIFAQKCIKKSRGYSSSMWQRCQLDAPRRRRNDDGFTSSLVRSPVQAFTRASAARRAADEEAARR